MRFIRAALVVLVVCAAVSTVAAQTGGLKVVVVDDAGQPLPAATVVLSSEQGFIKTTAELTNARGEVVFPVLRAGPGYVLEVSMPSFAPQRLDARVKINETQTITVQMMEEFTETVVVTAESSVVELDKTEVSTKFSDEFIQDLPVPGRFYTGVLTMAPGVQDDDGDGEVTVHGSRNRDFKTAVGGVANVDPLTGQSMALVNPNSIEEMEVVTAGAGVEFGRAQGGFANIIQKQGSNEFEGLAEVIYRSERFDGNGASDIRSDLVPEFEWYQPSVQVSGPLVKDKLWYRLSHEYIFREDPTNTGQSVEVTTTEQGINSDQLTWQVSPRNKLAFNYDWNPLEIDNLGVSSRVRPESTRAIDNDYTAYRLTWTAPFSAKVFFETIAAYQDRSSSVFPTTPGAVNNCIEDPRRTSLRETWCNDVIDSEVSGAFPLTVDASSQRFTMNSQATLYAGEFLGANHQVKFGFSVQNERYFQNRTQNPQITRFFRVENQEEVQGEPVDISRQDIFLASFSVPRTLSQEGTATVWSAYVQDQIKPLQNLTITAGILVDRESTNSDGLSPFDVEDELASYIERSRGLPTSERTDILFDEFTAFAGLEDFRNEIENQIGPGANLGCTGVCLLNTFLYNFRLPENINIVNTNVSPRLSVAWDPWSDGKTKIAASVGRYYNNLPLTIPLQEQTAARATLELVCINEACDPASSSDPTASISVVDRDLQTPYQDEWTVSFERELFAETLMRLTYINRKYRDQIQDIDLNHAPGDYGRCIDQQVPGAPVVQPITDPNDPLFGQFPNGGDGILDDCVGELFNPNRDEEGNADIGGGLTSFLQRPDGLPDLYVQNPIWGDIFLVGNFNKADYEGVTLEVIRRQYKGWEMQGSYTWSMARGDGEDFFQAIGDDRSLLEDEVGFQSNDRRHVVKLNATTITPWGFRFGTAISWQSGLPYSILATQSTRDAIPPPLENLGFSGARRRIRYVTGERNDQRNPSYWNVDVKFTKELRVGQRANMQLSAEVFNLLNDDTLQVYNLASASGQQIDGVNDSFRRFGRRFQLGAKVTF